MNIYRFELKSLIKSTVSWIVSLSVICVLLMSIFPTYAESEDVIRQMVAGFPPEVIAAFGMNMDTLFSVIGFYSFLFMYIAFCGAVQAANLGIGIVSRENRAKTADFLLTKPVERRTVLTAKLFAALTALVVTNMVYLGISTAICYAVKDEAFDLNTLLLISLTLFFIQLTFVCIGAVVAAFSRRIKSVTTASLGLTLLFFMLSMVDAFVEKDAMKYITPFRYFDATSIALNRSYDWSSIVTVLVVCTICVTIAYGRTIRQDVHAV